MRKTLTAEEKLRSVASKLTKSTEENIITLQIDLTDFCVCKCKGCEHWKWPVKTKLDIATIEKNIYPFFEIENSTSLQSVVFSGGEPLLHPDAEEIIEHINDEYSLSVGIITSGLGRNDIDWEVLSKHCEWIRLSTDGFTPENYANTRGVDMFDKWTNNLKELLRANEQTKCETRLNVTIHEYNLHNFSDNLIEFLTNNNLQVEVYFWLSRELIDLFADKSESRLSKKMECGDVITKQLISLTMLASHRQYDANFLNFTNVLRHVNQSSDETRYSYHSCYVPQMFSLIAADGNVFPCCYMYEPVFSIDKQQLQFVIGNVNEQSLLDIYNSKKYLEIVEQFRRCNKQYPQCKFCDRYDHLNNYLNNYHEPNQSIFI
jgi:MoaA/NifB/PqqE/SkfB family radical SAM enzyme